jgi:hypothetical protein
MSDSFSTASENMLEADLSNRNAPLKPGWLTIFASVVPIFQNPGADWWQAKQAENARRRAEAEKACRSVARGRGPRAQRSEALAAGLRDNGLSKVVSWWALRWDVRWRSAFVRITYSSRTIAPCPNAPNDISRHSKQCHYFDHLVGAGERGGGMVRIGA